MSKLQASCFWFLLFPALFLFLFSQYPAWYLPQFPQIFPAWILYGKPLFCIPPALALRRLFWYRFLLKDCCFLYNRFWHFPSKFPSFKPICYLLNSLSNCLFHCRSCSNNHLCLPSGRFRFFYRKNPSFCRFLHCRRFYLYVNHICVIDISAVALLPLLPLILSTTMNPLLE